MTFRVFSIALLVSLLFGCVAGKEPASEMADTDGDGVIDAADMCVNTKFNIPVDARGCPSFISSGQESYIKQCQNCHGTEKGADVTLGGALTKAECETCSSFSLLATKIREEMPVVAPSSCHQACAEKVAAYIFENFEGYGGVVPESSFTKVLEAENGVLEGELDPTANDHIRITNTNGRGFVGFVGNSQNSSVFYRQAFAITGTYNVTVHYASGSPRSLDISVDNTVHTLHALNSSDWDTFSEASIEVDIESKLSDIRIGGNDPAGWSPNIDKLVFTLVKAKEPEPVDCGQFAFGSTPLQRLNSIEYRNSVQDILAMTATVDTSLLPGDASTGNFRANNIAPVSEGELEKYSLSAENLASQSAKSAKMLTGCELSFGNEVIGINVGGFAFTSEDGFYYHADPKGQVSEDLTFDQDVPDTADDPIYNSRRENGGTSYSIPVVNGRYRVVTHHADPFFGAGTRPYEGARIFDIIIEGEVVEKDFDIIAVTGGRYRKTDNFFEIEVTDGEFNISTKNVKHRAVLSGIRLERIYPGEIAINSGGPAYTAKSGLVYRADEYFTGGNATPLNTNEIVATVDDALYNQARRGRSFSYEIPLEAGVYRVLLQTAERFNDGNNAGVGARVFDVKAEGAIVFDDLDLFSEVGFSTAVDKTFEIEVLDGGLSLDFKASVSSAYLGGIVIRPLARDGEQNEVQCFNEFIKRFGSMAFRRPLTAEEVIRYTGTYNSAKDEHNDAEEGFKTFVASILQSPHFLYRVEGSNDRSAYLNGEVVPLTAHELATRLSFFLWSTTPNADLLRMADSGELLDSTIYSEQVTRMLADSRRAHGLHNFFEQWLEIEEIGKKDKAPELFPSYSENLAQAMLQDTLEFIDATYERNDATYKDLLAPGGFTYTDNAELLAIYGVSPSTEGEPVALPTNERAGLLTQPSVMTVLSHSAQSSPILRGAYVRERFLCQNLPSPPANVNDVAPEISADATTRERFTQHSVDPSCNNCHALIDPIGFTLEAYDAVGGFRLEENGKLLDLTGDLVGTDVEDLLDGPIELSNAVGGSRLAQACFVENWLEYSLSRSLKSADSCVLEKLADEFSSSEGNLTELIKQIVESPAFKSTRVNLGEAPK